MRSETDKILESMRCMLRDMRMSGFLVSAETTRKGIAEIERLQNELAELQVKEGPLNTERWTLDALITKLEEWKVIASGKTCVSFENLCFGASSLWHQAHRESFRAIDRKPEALSKWILETEHVIKQDFPAQVLAVLKRLQAIVDRLDPPPGQCEHGVKDGDLCEPCNREYKRAADFAELAERAIAARQVQRCDDFDGEPIEGVRHYNG